MNKSEEQKKIDQDIKAFKSQEIEKGYIPASTKEGIIFDKGETQSEEWIKRLEEKIEVIEKRTFFSEKLNDVYTSAPTYIPKTFNQQFVLYDTGGVRRLYVYVNGSWRYTILT